VYDDSSLLAPVRLENTKPTAIRVRGANIIPFPYYSKTNTNNGITFTVNDDGSITINGTATGRAEFILGVGIPLIPTESYTISASVNETWPNGVSFIAGVTYDANLPMSYTPLYYNTPAQPLVSDGYSVDYLRIRIDSGTVCDNLIFKPMINIGTTAVPYKSYKAPIEITLPETITSLTNLSLGIYSEAYNECDFVNNKYIRRCGIKTLVGTESYNYYKLGSRSRFQHSCPTDARYWAGYHELSQQKCDYFEWDKLASEINSNDTIKNKMLSNSGSWFFYVDDAIVQDTNTWKAFLAEHNMRVVYELAEAKSEELNIGNFNPLIEVEGGGSIEFITDSGYATNSTIIFQTIM
jgi:hypothetical protein